MPANATEKTSKRTAHFSCKQCGGSLLFDPEVGALACLYCRRAADVLAVGEAQNADPPGQRDAAEELDFQDHLDALVSSDETLETTVVSCPGCGAAPTLAANVTADECPFCSTPLVTEGAAQRTLKPGAVLPFRVARSEAMQRWRAWVVGLWFAPSRFKERARLDEKLQGVYFPFWTYDCQTTTDYVAERGEDEYVTRRAAMSSSTGGAGKGSRRVRKTRWKTIRGTRTDSFDDVLIPASRSLSSSLLEKLEPWDLEHLESHRQEFLSGFRAESYGVGLAVGFERAKERIGSELRRRVREAVGGDRQRIRHLETEHRDVTFKYILLPVWVSAFRYHDEVYRFVVNARTGEVQGQRPWSWVKLTLAGLAAAAFVAGVTYFAWR